MYINNRRDSSKLKGCSPIEVYRNLKIECSAIAYFSYTER